MLNRRQALRGFLGLGAGAAALAACGATPTAQVIEQEVTRVVEQEVTRIVEGTPQIVRETVVVTETQIVEKVVTAAVVQEPVTVTVMQWGNALGVPDEVRAGCFARFVEKHPDIKPEIEAAPWAEYWTKVNTLAASNQMPDLYSQSIAYCWDHANKGISVDLQPLLERDIDLDEYYMEIDLNSLRYSDMQKGDLYSFPLNWTGTALFYNKDAFDEAGVGYPTKEWTYDDMLSAAKLLTKLEGEETTRWGMEAPRGYLDLDGAIKAYGGAVISPDYRRCMLTEPEAIEAIQWSVDLIHVHQVAPTPAVQQGFVGGAFPTGMVAMGLYNTYRTGSWKESEFEFDISYVPKGPVSRVMSAGPDMVSISTSTSDREAAWKLLAHYISEEEQKLLEVVEVGTVPFLRAAADSESWIRRPGHAESQGVILDSEAYEYRGVDGGSGWEEWRSVLTNELDLAFLGQRPVGESVAAACAGIDMVLDAVEWPE